MAEKPPEITARSLLRRIERAGGRVYRMPAGSVFVLTDSRELAEGLVKLGGRPYMPQGSDPAMEAGAYLRARGGKMEWDIYIHAIQVSGEESIWEAAGRRVKIETVVAVDFA